MFRVAVMEHPVFCQLSVFAREGKNTVFRV
jgi:hypothetical protein